LPLWGEATNNVLLQFQPEFTGLQLAIGNWQSAMTMRGNRYQFGLTLLTGFFLLATFLAVLLYALTPTRGPVLLAAFVAILLGSLVCILFFLRWMLRPYRQLVGEAEKASGVESQPHKVKDEAEFVLETFQSVVGQQAISLAGITTRAPRH
jgi:hypothetical protein